MTSAESLSLSVMIALRRPSVASSSSKPSRATRLSSATISIALTRLADG
jgi:hypothetical protein